VNGLFTPARGCEVYIKASRGLCLWGVLTVSLLSGDFRPVRGVRAANLDRSRVIACRKAFWWHGIVQL